MDQNGVAALYVREGIEFNKIQDGGYQEKNKRSGTENVAGIVGLGKAIEFAYKNVNEYNSKLIELREYYFESVQKRIKDIRINGDRLDRLPGNANISIKGIDRRNFTFKIRFGWNMLFSGICV